MFIGGAKDTSLLGAATSAPEIYIPLWWYSGSMVSTTNVSAGSASSSPLKGGIATGSTAAKNLHTLSSNWPVSTKFAFEASMAISNSAATANAQLWDFTTNALVGSTQIMTTATTTTVVRSGQFALTPGHVYGISLWNNQSASYTTYLTDASLIVFPS